MALLICVASVAVQGQAERRSISGVVVDPSGTRVSHTTVTADRQGGKNSEITHANAAGEYRFNSIPAGEYVLKFAAPDFAPTKMNVLSPEVISAGVDARLSKLAVDAIKQWRYEPALLNGEPIEAATTVTVNFELEPAAR